MNVGGEGGGGGIKRIIGTVRERERERERGRKQELKKEI